MLAVSLMKVRFILHVDNHKRGKSKGYYWQALNTIDSCDIFVLKRIKSSTVLKLLNTIMILLLTCPKLS